MQIHVLKLYTYTNNYCNYIIIIKVYEKQIRVANNQTTSDRLQICNKYVRNFISYNNITKEFCLINKMNKNSHSRLSTRSLKPDKMRVLYRKRNNYRQTYEPNKNNITSKSSLSASRIIIQQPQSNTFNNIKAFVQSRMKTQYNDKYQGVQLHQNTFTPMRLSRYIPKQEPQSIKTLDVISDNNKHSLQKELRKQSNAPQNKSFVKNLIINQQIQKQPQSLDSIEKNVQSFLEKRLEKYLENKERSQWKGDHSMDNLISALKNMKSQENPQNSISVKHVDKKINVLEKLMAENNLESQIMKKQFFSKISRSSSKQQKPNINNKREIVKNVHQQIKKFQNFINTSESHQSFRKPDKNAYKICRYTKSFFSNDRRAQPIPRSSYGRDYLQYRGVTPIPSSQISQNNLLKYPGSAKLINSSYQQEFGLKKVQKINVKQLDACKDKFKNLPIVFGQKQKNPMIAKLKYYIKAINSVQSVKSMQDMPYLSSSLMTESRRQFKKVQQPSVSQIKHHNLQKLKYQYKKRLNV